MSSANDRCAACGDAFGWHAETKWIEGLRFHNHCWPPKMSAAAPLPPDRIRPMEEVLADLAAVAANFDRGWRAEAPTMAALVRRVARDVSSAWEARAPTQDAYNATCAALAHWRSEAWRLGEIAGEYPVEMSKKQ